MTSMTIIDLDPRKILDHPGNVRTDPGDLSGLIASIAEFGVLEPVLVVTNGDGWKVLAGKRRVAAAVKAGLATVPAIVRDDLDEIGQRYGSLIENVQRKDLTAVEEAAAIEQLSLAGVEVEAIATLSGLPPDRVQRALAVAQSDVARKAAPKLQLSLEQAAGLAEFDANKNAVERLVGAAKRSPGQFDHELSYLRREREIDVAVAVELQRLVDAKTVVLTERPSYDRNLAKTVRLDYLDGKAGKAMTLAGHKKCPGHAAWVGASHSGAETVYVCTDPRGNGHKIRKGYTDEGTGSASGSTAGDAEKRREVIANNKAWRAAEDVRRTYVASLLKRKASAVKGCLRWCVEEIMRNPSSFGTGDETMLGMLLGVQPDHAAAHNLSDPDHDYGHMIGVDRTRAAADSELPMMLLAQLAADREGGMGLWTWRSQCADDAARWLNFLERNGYELADVERLVVDRAAGYYAKKAAAKK